MRINIACIVPPNYPGVRAFDELRETLRCALRRLGHDVIETANGFHANRLNVLFGGHLLGRHHHQQLPAQVIVYNTEQLNSGSAVIHPHYMELLSRRPVWDYSAANLRWLVANLPECRAVHLPVGFVPEMRRIRPADRPDIDVLFYGDINDRRESVLRRLVDARIRLQTLLNCFGAERDALIARSKLVLNVHAFDTRIFEVVRVSYLLANGRPVVTELDDQTEIEADLRDAVAGAPADRIALVVQSLLDDVEARRELAGRGQRIFERRDAVAWTRAALAATPLP